LGCMPFIPLPNSCLIKLNC